ncbi:ABC-three component system middle component 6 [Sulfurimonas sp. CS5]|uniref:ABC-three component system middle component 6 n=1 Tax=Sulfurimonas sp. CS5 TaxID=3391145 RepID=UPI0039EB5B80
MIMPAKHINFSESFLGLGSYILQNLSEPRSVDELWQMYQQDLQNELYFAKHSFDNLIMTILFLYSIDAVKEIDAKVVKNETY